MRPAPHPPSPTLPFPGVSGCTGRVRPHPHHVVAPDLIRGPALPAALR